MPRIESHFARLSKEMGFEVEVPIRRVREAVFKLGRDGRADLALPVAETLVQWSPDRDLAQYALGEALEFACRPKEAQAPYREAVRLAKVQGRSPAWVRREENLDRAERGIPVGDCGATIQ